MPISVLCPSCNSKLNAPDSAAGKRVKCPKCQVLMELPAAEPDYEELDDEPAPPPIMAKSKPKPAGKPVTEEEDDDEQPVRRKPHRRRAESDDEENDDEENERPSKRRASRRERDEEEDERPRKKSRKKAKPKSNLPLILGIGVGVLVLAGVGFGVFMLLNNGGESGPRPQSQQNNSQPGGGQQRSESANWPQVDNADFTAKMVAQPQERTAREGDGPSAVTSRIYIAAGPQGDRVHLVKVYVLPQQLADEVNSQNSLVGVDKFLNETGKGTGVVTLNAETQVGGVKARAFTSSERGKQLYGRILAANGKIFILLAGGDNMTDDSPHMQEFFNSFKPK